jgi:hypothetical protein
MNIMPLEPGSLGWILVWQQGRPVLAGTCIPVKDALTREKYEGLEKLPGCDRTKTFFSGMQMYYIVMSPFGKKPLTYMEELNVLPSEMLLSEEQHTIVYSFASL